MDLIAAPFTDQYSNQQHLHRKEKVLSLRWEIVTHAARRMELHMFRHRIAVFKSTADSSVNGCRSVRPFTLLF